MPKPQNPQNATTAVIAGTHALMDATTIALDAGKILKESQKIDRIAIIGQTGQKADSLWLFLASSEKKTEHGVSVFGRIGVSFTLPKPNNRRKQIRFCRSKDPKKERVALENGALLVDVHDGGFLQKPEKRRDIPSYFGFILDSKSPKKVTKRVRCSRPSLPFRLWEFCAKP